MRNDLKNPKPLPPPSKYLNWSRPMLQRTLEERDLEISFLNDRIKQIEAREAAMINTKLSIDDLYKQVQEIKSFLVI